MMGSGIIVVKWVGEWKVLALEASSEIKKKNDGVYDIPKGQIDKGESAWQTATREAFEEASLILGQEEVIFGPYQDSWLTLWVCEILPSENPQIQPNPQSGILEHESFEWLDFETMHAYCYSYLKPFIMMAKQDLENTDSLYTT